MNQKELKQKLRKLKKLELMYRYGYSASYIEKSLPSTAIEKLPLVWYEFFNMKESKGNIAKYQIHTLEQMDKEQLKQVFDEYWFRLYYRIYQEKGVLMEVQDPKLLDFLGLPYDADKSMIKKRFRELCKTYHPDEGGDKEKFIELMEMIEKYDLK
jgi:hypothetical protein